MLALQALCAFDALGDDFRNQLGRFLMDEQVLSDLDMSSPPPEGVVAFAVKLIDGVWARRRSLDEHLERTAVHWRIGRMTPVDRNVLRLSLFELLEASPDAPPQVVIDEAIELARQFGDTDSPAFVNGVLDALRRELAGTDSGSGSSTYLNP